MIDLKVRVRGWGEPVFRENAIVAGSRPMPVLTRAAIAANVRRIGRAHRTRGKSRVGQHSRMRERAFGILPNGAEGDGHGEDRGGERGRDAVAASHVTHLGVLLLLLFY